MGIIELTLGLTLGISSWTDWHERKIYNKVLGPAFILALVLNTYYGGWNGTKSSLIGLLIGFCILLIPYFLGGIGAGDVKLLAVIGAFGGPYFVINAFLYGAILGGLVSMFLMYRRGVLLVTLKKYLLCLPFLTRLQDLGDIADTTYQEKFPYGIVLALGAVLAWIIPLRGLW